MGMLDSHPLNIGIKIKEPCENKVPGNKIYLGIIFKKLNQTWECCIPMTIFPGIFFKTLKQTHPYYTNLKGLPLLIDIEIG